MSHAESAGRLIWCALPGPELDGPTLSRLTDLRPAGVIFFDRNLRSPQQTGQLAEAVRAVCGPATFVGIDQEGGRVNRLREVFPVLKRLPSARAQARWSSFRLERTWRALGRCLCALGIDVDFAPVVDLDDSEGSNAIGERAYGREPALVARSARTVVAALGREGVVACLKHFPGLGGTTADTHHASSVSPTDSRALWDLHVKPYRDLVELAPLVMTSHAAYPGVEGSGTFPATFSRVLITDWLRGRVGFRGVVITDDLGMRAAAIEGDPGQLARRATAAGVDWVLFCGDLDAPLAARDDLADAIESGALDREALAVSGSRVAALRARHAAKGRERDLARAIEVLEASLEA